MHVWKKGDSDSKKPLKEKERRWGVSRGTEQIAREWCAKLCAEEFKDAHPKISGNCVVKKKKGKGWPNRITRQGGNGKRTTSRMKL